MSAIGFDQALRAILSAVQQLAQEKVPLSRALGRIAGTRVLADEDAVPYARSAMDGYAVRAIDCAPASTVHPVELFVSGKVFAEKGRIGARSQNRTGDYDGRAPSTRRRRRNPKRTGSM